MEALFEKELPVLLRLGAREERYVYAYKFYITNKEILYRRHVRVKCNITLNTPSTPVTKKVKNKTKCVQVLVQ